jgi:hypothetical protein
MKDTRNKYIPGVCNIGPAEMAKRRQVGWIGIGVAVVLVALLILLKAPAAVRLLAFFPVTIAASGFLQSYLHFCAGFGSKGLFNFGPEVGKTDSVDQAEFRVKDRHRAAQIIIGSAAIGLVVAVICVLI